MVKSMTGFGRCEISEGNQKLSVEMKGVNHRYLDVNIRMPKKLSFFETAIRQHLKKYVSRGKVDIFITYEDHSEEQLSLNYNEALAQEYLGYLKKMSKDFGLENDIRVSALSRFPEVFSMQEQTIDQEGLWQILKKALTGACTQFVETRISEGQALQEDILQKLSEMTRSVTLIEERSPDILKEYRAKLEAKVAELLESKQLDEGRIAQEVVMFADKICTDEEVVRLNSHVNQMAKTLEEEDGAGRKLDFIAQEMNREANTILSKANDMEVSNLAIELKTGVEKIREQIQNIE